MRKALLFAVALAVVLAAAVPTFARETAAVARGVDCDRVQAAAASRSAQGSDGAVDPGKAAAIARDLGASRGRVAVCLESGVPLDGAASGNGAAAGATTSERGGAPPETGGVPPIGLGAGVLLVAGGHLLRRIFR